MYQHLADARLGAEEPEVPGRGMGGLRRCGWESLCVTRGTRWGLSSSRQSPEERCLYLCIK